MMEAALRPPGMSRAGRRTSAAIVARASPGIPRRAWVASIQPVTWLASACESASCDPRCSAALNSCSASWWRPRPACSMRQPGHAGRTTWRPAGAAPTLAQAASGAARESPSLGKVASSPFSRVPPSRYGEIPWRSASRTISAQPSVPGQRTYCRRGANSGSRPLSFTRRLCMTSCESTSRRH